MQEAVLRRNTCRVLFRYSLRVHFALRGTHHFLSFATFGMHDDDDGFLMTACTTTRDLDYGLNAANIGIHW